MVDNIGAPALGAMRVTSAGHLYRATEASLLRRGCRCRGTASQACTDQTPPVGRGDNGYYNQTAQAFLEKPPGAAGTIGRRLNYVFSPDDRTQVGGTTSYPWRTIGQINMKASDGKKYTCSGATVGTRAVLTAGHCVHSGPGGAGWYDVQFSAGRSCGSCNPYGTLPWSHITTYRAWTNSKDWR